MRNYIHSFWPAEPELSGRDFGLWYYRKGKGPLNIPKIGDRVLLYETGKHVDSPKVKGSKRIFGSVTVIKEMIEFPINKYKEVGGRPWNIMVPIQIDYICERKNGIEMEKVREILGWSKKGSIRNPPIKISQEAFIRIENELKGKYDDRDFFINSDEKESPSYKEGKKYLRKHWAYERDQNAIRDAKEIFLKENDKLFCSICGFSFEERYGPLGTNIIEVHHTKPLSQYKKERKTHVSELIVLCSNCHRIIHSKIPSFTLDLVKNSLK